LKLDLKRLKKKIKKFLILLCEDMALMDIPFWLREEYLEAIKREEAERKRIFKE